MAQPSQDRIDAVLATVRADLDPPPAAVHGRLAAAMAVGGGLSLLLCGQFGLGLTPSAAAFSMTLHHRLGAIPCALICGALFAVLPTVMLWLVSRPMLFRVLARRRLGVITAWYAVAGTLLVVLGEQQAGAAELLAWLVAAAAIFVIGGRALDEVAGAMGGTGPPSRTAG